MQPFKLDNAAVVLKYLNCLERVLFIDNRWMKYYDDLKDNKPRQFEGVPLYFKKIIKSFNEKGLVLFENSLPNKDERLETSEMDGIILESIPNFIGEDEEENHLTVIACPDVDRIFYFKCKQSSGDLSLKKAKINNFSCYPTLPRIKIQSKNVHIFEDSGRLSDLKFLYALLVDADIESNSFKSVSGKINFNNLIPDPSMGVQMGSLAKYYISSFKIVGFKRFHENIHQIILIVKDWKNETFEVYITTELFRTFFNAIPTEEFFNEPRFVRALIIQGFCQKFKHILKLEKSSKEELLDDSLFAHIRFRKNVKKVDLQLLPGQLPSHIYEQERYYTYFNESISLEAYNDYLELKKTNKLALPKIMLSLKKVSRLFEFNPELKEIYENNIDESSCFIPLIIEESSPFGLHKYLLQDPVEALRYYVLNTEMTFFCINCKKFTKTIRLFELPNTCPVCNTKKIIQLVKCKDEFLFMERMDKRLSELDMHKIEHYGALAELFSKYGKYIYWARAATSLSYRKCLPVLQSLSKSGFNERGFFEIMHKINKENYNDNSYLNNEDKEV